MTSTSHLLPCWEHQSFIQILQNYKVQQSWTHKLKDLRTKGLTNEGERSPIYTKRWEPYH